MFLALDTVFGQCSVAVVSSSGDILFNDTQLGKREQTQQILPMVQSALKDTDLTLDELSALVFNRGPGAFSGIRINTAVVQALSVAHDLPCVGISSLQVMAQAANEQYQLDRCYAAHDARMKQVYLGAFAVNNGIIQPLPSAIEAQGHECLLDYDAKTLLNLALVGDGAPLLTLQGDQSIFADIQTDAAILGRLGAAHFAINGGVAAEQALPVYLRNHAWKTLKEQGKA
ncbi:tRNA (adenosine(37)-N6)-threonylcarbamoyltransferase complex dimerization subunit type 1 TsaB [Psychrobacter pygoscelis]|uniref:tRNA (adenosine(37)-N6)-threonylcarbamoyltransferase complex dimerization subunit type 1 TsaB n=1 Tax=Psychrobacter pygoscelis TaxID=2488563 RepID=UPI00103F723B|nr:tRNA (adenosine(37)-N6)-threonylcarbamoyltransferase complex dimerization subunit type 1 TsaB [Psychrobacter pygoscelis]